MKLLTYSAPVFLLSAFSLFSTAHADAWNCSNIDLVREVVIEYPEGGAVPCDVVYKKSMEGFDDQILWNAMNEEGYCEQRASEFIVKLESWGWDCAEAASSDVAETVEDSGSNATTEQEISSEAAPAVDEAPEHGISSEPESGDGAVSEQSVDLPQVESVDTNSPVADKMH